MEPFDVAKALITLSLVWSLPVMVLVWLLNRLEDVLR